MAIEPERAERFEGTGVNRKSVVTTYTGIYSHEQITYTKSAVGNKEIAERLDDVLGIGHNEPSSLEDHLASCERCAESVLKEHGLTWPWTDENEKSRAERDALIRDANGAPWNDPVLRQRMNEINTYSAAVRDAEPIVRVANALLWDIRGLRQSMGASNPDHREIAWTAYEIGRRAEMLCVIPFEPDCLRYQRNMTKLNKTRNEVFGDPDAKTLLVVETTKGFKKQFPKEKMRDIERRVEVETGIPIPTQRYHRKKFINKS